MNGIELCQVMDVLGAEIIACAELALLLRRQAAGALKAAIIARRGKEARNIAKVAAARRLPTLVFYGLSDGQIRCLSQPPTAHTAHRQRGHEQLFLASGQARGRLLCLPRRPHWQRGRPLD